ncbi:MAG: hypothetical protein M3271_09375 [Actinomycetota bacterium]|nr:hypothetical protein [Actinomycetota bacterium]
MAEERVIDVLTSRAFLALGIPALAVLVELVVRLNAKADDEPAFVWGDLDYGASLLAMAFVSVPALLAARAQAVEDASAGIARLEASALALGAFGMALIGLLAILVGVYDRRIARRYRAADHGVLSPLMGVCVELGVGVMALSVVYAVTPGAV